uniref:SFRICE_035834 n=1 Tax=Spodoptera frugiperda TaxID=7108 RepID=A0A2H1VSR0_SPOFR
MCIKGDIEIPQLSEEELVHEATILFVPDVWFIHNINNAKIGGVKRLGRNRVSVEFESHEDANSFLVNCAFLQNYNLSIPLFNIPRMGIVRDVPVEWTEDEIIDNVRVPTGCGIVIKARRMN